MDLIFSYVEDVGDVFYHLLVRPGCLRFSGTIRRGRQDDVGSTSCAVDRRCRAGRDKDGRGGIGHVVDCGANLDKMVKWGRAGLMKAEKVLTKVFVVVVEDQKWGSHFGVE